MTGVYTVGERDLGGRACASRPPLAVRRVGWSVNSYRNLLSTYFIREKAIYCWYSSLINVGCRGIRIIEIENDFNQFWLFTVLQVIEYKPCNNTKAIRLNTIRSRLERMLQTHNAAFFHPKHSRSPIPRCFLLRLSCFQRDLICL